MFYNKPPKIKVLLCFLAVAVAFATAFTSCASMGQFMPLTRSETPIGNVQASFVAKLTWFTHDAVNTLAYIKLLEAAEAKFEGNIEIRDIQWVSGRQVENLHDEIFATGKVILRGAESYTITLLAYTGGTLVDSKGTKSVAGHASISLNRGGVWGFYPDEAGKLITKRGLLKYSDEFPRAQEYAEFTIDACAMNKISELLVEWETEPPYFAIPFSDCVGFIYSVCDIVDLKYNPLVLLPVDAIRSIRRLNPKKNAR
jgi:hypothetical protein